MEYVDAQVTHPMYPTETSDSEECRSNQGQSNLRDFHFRISGKLLNVSCHLANRSQSTTLVQPSNLHVNYKKLLSTNSTNNEVSKTENDYTLELQSLRIRGTKAQTLLACEIVNSFNMSHPKPAKLSESSLVEDAMTKRIASLSLIITGILICPINIYRENFIILIETEPSLLNWKLLL